MNDCKKEKIILLMTTKSMKISRSPIMASLRAKFHSKTRPTKGLCVSTQYDGRLKIIKETCTRNAIGYRPMYMKACKSGKEGL